VSAMRSTSSSSKSALSAADSVLASKFYCLDKVKAVRPHLFEHCFNRLIALARIGKSTTLKSKHSSLVSPLFSRPRVRLLVRLRNLLHFPVAVTVARRFFVT
jgi:hypothetical protein